MLNHRLTSSRNDIQTINYQRFKSIFSSPNHKMTKSAQTCKKQHRFIIFSHFRPFSSAQFNIRQRHPIRKRLKKESPMKYDESERSTKPDSISPESDFCMDM